MLLSTAYFPPIEYFAKIAEGFDLSPDPVKPSVVYLDACEHYQKQSYRNRCKYCTESGVQTLSFPIVHEGDTYNLPVSRIRIDWSTPWLRQTENAIETAYDSSAYFEYYRDGLFDVLDSRPEYLWDFNLQIIKYFLEKTGIVADIRETTEYTPQNSGIYGEDLREVIHPKRDNGILTQLKLGKPYFQVFARKHGFIPNLSIMDLLFNEGPESILYLKKF